MRELRLLRELVVCMESVALTKIAHTAMTKLKAQQKKGRYSELVK